MVAGLPQSGVELIVKGLDAFLSDVRRYQDSLGQMNTATQNAANGAKSAAAGTEALNRSYKELADAASKVGMPIAALGAALTGVATVSVLAAARYEELGIALGVAGQNAGYSERELVGFEEALTKTGLSAAGSREFLMRLIQSEISLTDATKLARAAQDLAVIGMADSTETANDLAYAISSLNVRILRKYGIVGTLIPILEQYGRSLGLSGEALKAFTADADDSTKKQAMLQYVLQEAGKFTGVYEAAMGSASKQMRSFQRYVSDLAVEMGGFLMPALNAVVFTAKYLIERFRELPEPIKQIIAVGGGMTGVFALMSGTFLLLLPRIVSTVQAFGTIGKALSAISTAAGGAGTAMSGLGMVLTGPLGIGLLAAAAAVGVLTWYFTAQAQKAEYLKARLGELKEKYQVLITKEQLDAVETYNRFISDQYSLWDTGAVMLDLLFNKESFYRKEKQAQIAVLAQYMGQLEELDKQLRLGTITQEEYEEKARAIAAAINEWSIANDEALSKQRMWGEVSGIVTAAIGQQTQAMFDNALAQELLATGYSASHLAAMKAALGEKEYSAWLRKTAEAAGIAVPAASKLSTAEQAQADAAQKAADAQADLSSSVRDSVGKYTSASRALEIYSRSGDKATVQSELFSGAVDIIAQSGLQGAYAVEAYAYALDQAAIAAEAAAVASANAAIGFWKSNAAMAQDIIDYYTDAAGAATGAMDSIARKQADMEAERSANARTAALEQRYWYEDQIQWITDNEAGLTEELQQEFIARTEAVKAEADKVKENNAALAEELLDAENWYQKEKAKIMQMENEEQRAAALAILEREYGERVTRAKERADLEAQIEAEKFAREVEMARSAGAAGGQAMAEEFGKEFENIIQDVQTLYNDASKAAEQGIKLPDAVVQQTIGNLNRLREIVINAPVPPELREALLELLDLSYADLQRVGGKAEEVAASTGAAWGKAGRDAAQEWEGVGTAIKNLTDREHVVKVKFQPDKPPDYAIPESPKTRLQHRLERLKEWAERNPIEIQFGTAGLAGVMAQRMARASTPAAMMGSTFAPWRGSPTVNVQPSTVVVEKDARQFNATFAGRAPRPSSGSVSTDFMLWQLGG